MSTVIKPPPPRVRIADETGAVTLPWDLFFRALVERIGGFNAPTLTDLETDIAALEAAVNALEATVEGLDSGANTVSATLDFGASFTDKAQTVVTGQAWVTASSVITPTVMCPIGIDTDEIRLLDMRPVISDLVAGVGFTVTLYSEPEARGTYTVSCVGV